MELIELLYGFLILWRMRVGDLFEVGLEEILEEKIIPVSFIFREVVKDSKRIVKF